MKKLGLIILLIGVSYVYPQSVNITQADREIVSTLFNGDWQRSDSLIDLRLADMPDHPKYYFMKAFNAFYCRVVGNDGMSRAESIRNVNYYAWKAIQVGNKLPETTDVKFYMGLAYAFLSRANVMERYMWYAYWNASESQNYLEDVVDENPHLADAYFNLGVTEYFPAVAVTGFQGALAWIGGMSGDREKGLDYIHLAAEKGDLFKDEAKFAIGVIYRFRENDPQKIRENMLDLKNKYPGSAAINNSYTVAELTYKIETEGVDFLETDFDYLKEKYSITSSFTLNGIGYNLIGQEKLNDALEVFKINVRLY
ncbi:MAG: hypothetical protein ABIK27_00490, partial [Bacteroidota bacterium]